MISDYNCEDLITGLLTCGIGRGMVVFSHSNIGFFGRPADVRSGVDACRVIYEAIQNVIGAEGTLVVPCFTFSFGSEKAERVFDMDRTPSICGMFTEYVRKLPGAIRSADPMFSVAAIGPKADALTRDPAPECFGENSFWRRFIDHDGMICNLNYDASSTLVHFVERRMKVSYRKNRSFHGTVIQNETARDTKVVYFCRAHEDMKTVPNMKRFNEIARQRGFSRTAGVGRGSIIAISAADTVRIIETMLPGEPHFLTDFGADVFAKQTMAQ